LAEGPHKWVSDYGHVILGPGEWSWARQHGERERLYVRTMVSKVDDLRYDHVVYDLDNDLYSDWMKQAQMETGPVSNKVRVADCLEAAMAPAELAVATPKYVAAMGLGAWLLKWHVRLSTGASTGRRWSPSFWPRSRARQRPGARRRASRRQFWELEGRGRRAGGRRWKVTPHVACARRSRARPRAGRRGASRQRCTWRSRSQAAVKAPEAAAATSPDSPGRAEDPPAREPVTKGGDLGEAGGRVGEPLGSAGRPESVAGATWSEQSRRANGQQDWSGSDSAPAETAAETKDSTAAPGTLGDSAPEQPHWSERRERPEPLNPNDMDTDADFPIMSTRAFLRTNVLCEPGRFQKFHAEATGQIDATTAGSGDVEMLERALGEHWPRHQLHYEAGACQPWGHCSAHRLGAPAGHDWG